MAFAGVAGANAGKLQRHDFAVEQRHQPAHRTHKALGRLAAPVHVLRPVNAGDFFGQRFGKNLGCGAAFLLHGRREIFALRSRDLLQRIDRDVDLAREGFGRGSRHSVFVGDLERRPGTCSRDVGLRSSNSGGEHGQAAWSGVRLRRAGAVDQALALQQFADAASQFLARAVDHPGGNFFGTDFE